MGYALVIASIIGVVGLFAMALEWTTGNSGFQLFVDFLLIMPTCIIVWLLGIAALLGSGYRVTYYTRKPNVEAKAEVDPLAKEEAETTQTTSINLSNRPATLSARGTLQARWLAVGLATLTLFSVFSGSIYDHFEIQRFTALQDPSAYFQAPVDRIDYRGRQIFGVTMAPIATAADVERVAARVPQLSRLSVAGTQLGDNDMAVFDKFTNLTELDLSKTPVTGKGLEHLKKLESLSLADTQVTFVEAMRYTNLKAVGKLDLSGLNITDDQLKNEDYTNGFFQELSLARNPITDSGLAVLFERVTVSSLDLSDTKVIGQSLESSNSLTSVKLDGTEVTDAVLLKLIANPNCACQQLSLRRTKITAAVLPALINHSVALGHGAITEADLMNLTGAAFQQLRLNGPEFTGESLTTGKIRVQSIDFSGSSVTDDILQRLTVLGWIQYIKLSNTSITNKGIERLNVSEMDLRGSKIDTTTLLEKMSNMVLGRILLRHETVTPQQRVKARHSRISWDEGSYVYEW